MASGNGSIKYWSKIIGWENIGLCLRLGECLSITLSKTCPSHPCSRTASRYYAGTAQQHDGTDTEHITDDVADWWHHDTGYVRAACGYITAGCAYPKPGFFYIVFNNIWVNLCTSLNKPNGV